MAEKEHERHVSSIGRLAGDPVMAAEENKLHKATMKAIDAELSKRQKTRQPVAKPRKKVSIDDG